MLVADDFKDLPVLLFTGRYFQAQKGPKGGPFGGQQYIGVRAIQKSRWSSPRRTSTSALRWLSWHSMARRTIASSSVDGRLAMPVLMTKKVYR